MASDEIHRLGDVISGARRSIAAMREVLAGKENHRYYQAAQDSLGDMIERLEFFVDGVDNDTIPKGYVVQSLKHTLPAYDMMSSEWAKWLDL